MESLISRRCWPYLEFLTRFILGAIFYFIVVFNFRLEYSFDCAEWLPAVVSVVGTKEEKKNSSWCWLVVLYPYTIFKLCIVLHSFLVCSLFIHAQKAEKKKRQLFLFLFFRSAAGKSTVPASSFPHLINVDTLCRGVNGWSNSVI